MKAFALRALLIAPLVCGMGHATDLRLYPTFGEVRQPLTLSATNGRAVHEQTFSRLAWNLLQPGSLSFFGAPLARIESWPTDLEWLATQEGQPVRVLRAGQAPLEATLVRASDLLVRLSSGDYLNVTPGELAFSSLPPRDGVRVRVEVAAQARVAGELSYRTAALSWQPRYELGAVGTQARLAALAEIRNLGGEAYEAGQVELFAGEVRQVSPGGLLSEQQAGAVLAGRTGTPTAASLNLAVSPVTGLGEVRGLQRYALAGGLTLRPGERLSVPFVQTTVTDFTRYDRVNSYFDRQERSGRASRHYKFTPGQSLPTGPLTVREGGALVGTVQLPATQTGRPVDLDLGADNELRYVRTVKQLAQEKTPAGKVLSTTFRVTYTLTSTKSTAVRVQVREQVYGRPLAVDGQAVQGQQVTVERGVGVPAGAKASLTFTLKLGAG